MDNRLVRFTKWLLDAMFYGGLVITLGIPVIFRYVGRYIQSFRVHYIGMTRFSLSSKCFLRK